MHKDIGVFIPKDFKGKQEDFIQDVLNEWQEEWENYEIKDTLINGSELQGVEKLSALTDIMVWYENVDDNSFKEIVKNYSLFNIVVVNIHCVK